jgi:serine/threonine protein kinase
LNKVLSFAKDCLKQFPSSLKLSYIQEILAKLNIINKNLVEKLQIFHNDLKSDNILMRIKTQPNDNNKCGSKKSEIELYMIDFGNSILNVQNKDTLALKKFTVKKYYQIYKAPDLSCARQDTDVKFSKLIAWYLGVIGFELCSGGVEHKMLTASPQSCNIIKYPQTTQQANANAFDIHIRNYRNEIYQGSRDLCFKPAMATYLQNALRFSDRSRLTGDGLTNKSLLNV